jgi:hypothetical protein
VGDTFVSWSHGRGKLINFLDHLKNDDGNIQFTTETERDGHHTFLDTDISYRKPDGSLGHRVYSKPTHTNTSMPITTITFPTNSTFNIGAQGQSPMR